jgi:hypothetical protein
MKLQGLYFNCIKRAGNVRLLFILGIIPAIITLIALIANTKIYDKYLDNFISFYESRPTYWAYLDIESKYRIPADWNMKKYNVLVELIKNCENGKLGKINKVKVWDGHGHVEEDISNYKSADCDWIITKYKETPININNYVNLLYFLWVIFAFYCPFIIVLPFKWIIDGYKKDKK